MENLVPQFENNLSLKDAREMNPLVLAFIGDGVQTLFVRTVLATSSTSKAGELHKEAILEVKASAQARLAESLLDVFTEEELGVYHRGRNAKAHAVSKNIELADYRKATGLEAVFGYLYLTGQTARLAEILKTRKS